ncbi:MAG: hypothetical protein AB7O54_08480 [Pseudomonadales bacterium]
MLAPLKVEDRVALYAQHILDKIPRVIGMIDRETFSRTSGCMDRTYWSWKFTDFPGARFQEGVCALAYVWSGLDSEAEYARNPALLRWIECALRFWLRIQRPAGDFDEAYPFERSLAATSFSTFYVAEAWRTLSAHDALPQLEDELLSGVSRAADWLTVNDETHGFLSNHLAAAAGALLHAGTMCSEVRYLERGAYFLDKILAHQSDEGWYEEYGGADPGYQTHGSFYLARCNELVPDERLVESLRKANDFAANFVHPDGSYSGEYASRNTQTYYPAAYEMSAAYCRSAVWIAAHMASGVETHRSVGVKSVDVYNLYPMLNNYVFAHRAASSSVPSVPALSPSTEPVLIFPAAGIVKIQTRTFSAFFGTKKGGVLKVFSRPDGSMLMSDCGYVGRLGSGQIVSSQTQQNDIPTQIRQGEIRISGRFFSVSRPVMAPVRFIGFRVFNLTFGRLKHISYWLKSLLVKFLIYRKSELDIRYERVLCWDEDQLVLSDNLTGSDLVRLTELRRGEQFTTIHMGSARYFVPNELIADAPEVLQIGGAELRLENKLFPAASIATETGQYSGEIT